jgi:hypothetical protein
MAVTISGTTGIQGNLQGNVTGAVTGNASTATLATNATTAVVASSASNIVPASNLGLATCKAWVNFNGTEPLSTITTRGAGESITVTAGSNIGVWNVSSGVASGVVGGNYFITSIGGVVNATLGGVVVATGGFQIIGVNNGTQYSIRLRNGAATVNETITGNNNPNLGFQVLITGIRSSYNVSSVVRTPGGSAGGDYTINFTTPMADANYLIVCNASDITNGTLNAGAAVVAPDVTGQTITSSRFHVLDNNSDTRIDTRLISFVVFGN